MRKKKPGQKGNPKKLTFDGRTLTYPQWSLETGIPLSTLRRRGRLAERGVWTIKDALTPIPYARARRLNAEKPTEPKRRRGRPVKYPMPGDI